jgi:hypothetical protein
LDIVFTLPMDSTQLVIVIVSLSLTLLLIVLGIQVFYILKEIRFSIQKVNKMLDDFGVMTGTVSGGFTNMAGLVSGLKAGIALITQLRPKEDTK